MSLEAKIELLTAAVVELTRVMQTQHAPAGSINWMHQNAQVYANPPHATIALDEDGRAAAYKLAEAERGAKEEVPNDPAEELKKSSPTTDTSPPSSQASVSYDDVKAVTIAVSKIDKAKAVAGLARFGAKNAKELQEKQWSDYVVYMKRVAAGEIDPESSHE